MAIVAEQWPIQGVPANPEAWLVSTGRFKAIDRLHRLRLGTRLRVKAWGAVTLTDRGMSDDKLICSDRRPSRTEIANVLRFFHFYARCKGGAESLATPTRPKRLRRPVRRDRGSRARSPVDQ